MVIKWIQKVRIKKGSLHRQLKIPKEKKIPVALLNKIINAKLGDTITNPTKIGKKKIKIRRRIKRKALLAKNLKKISSKSKKKKNGKKVK
tara:strand:+ start:322 stop:591 length:270 start_codon:yes stop_codon:yes gene_type:complete